MNISDLRHVSASSIAFCGALTLVGTPIVLAGSIPAAIFQRSIFVDFTTSIFSIGHDSFYLAYILSLKTLCKMPALPGLQNSSIGKKISTLFDKKLRPIHKSSSIFSSLFIRVIHIPCITIMFITHIALSIVSLIAIPISLAYGGQKQGLNEFIAHNFEPLRAVEDLTILVTGIIRPGYIKYAD